MIQENKEIRKQDNKYVRKNGLSYGNKKYTSAKIIQRVNRA